MGKKEYGLGETQYKEMADRVKIDIVYSIVLKKGGSTHNVLVKEKGENNLFGNIALERIIYLFDRKNQLKCEFGFCENNEQLDNISVKQGVKELNVIEFTSVFVSLPRIVIIPYDNIGLLEQGPFPFIESSNSIGTEIKIEDNMILEKFPIFKPYYSKEVGGFYQNPILVKNSTVKFPFKVIQGSKTIDAESKEKGENKDE